MARVPDLIVKVRVEWDRGEITHECPPEGSGAMPCCGRTPFEVPTTDRMTRDRSQVTCHTESP